MSIKNALAFIQEIERNSTLKNRIRPMLTGEGLSGVVKIGTEQELFFTEEELRSAFAIDWSMRFLHFSPKADP